MNKKLALITALAVIGVFAAVVVLKSDVDSSEFAFRVFRFPRESKNLTKLFNSWKAKYNKTYGGVEHDKRYKIFVENFQIIEKTNAKQNSYTLGLNKFSDLSKAEFSSLYLGLKKKPTLHRSNEATKILKISSDASIDWSQKGAVTAVKNQGQCGSCWAFSTTGSLEGLNFIKNGNLLSFSEQQLVDCAGDYGNEGCSGGMMEWALNYTSAQGIELEDSYPYTATDDTCQYDASLVVFKNTGFEFANSDSLLEQGVTLGPVSVSVEADTSDFQSYTSGVLNTEDCGTNLDHGVLAVGYDVASDGTGYWIVKNSWGADWGNNGYLWIARASGDGICGINMDNAYPTL